MEATSLPHHTPFVSVHAVRTHMRHSCTMLGVHQRAAAVQHAHEIGLLAPPSATP
jgi:ATP/maltotriose-dependent transcriptional regulator MalT